MQAVTELERAATPGAPKRTRDLVAVDRDPWSRQPKEDARRHRALMTYCQLGASRSLERVANLIGVRPSTIRRWSADDHWVARKDAYVQATMADHELQAREIQAQTRVEVMERSSVHLRYLAQSFVDDADAMDPKDRQALAMSIAKLALATDRPTGGTGVQVNVQVINAGPSAEQQLATIMRVLQNHPAVRDTIQGELIKEFGRG